MILCGIIKLFVEELAPLAEGSQIVVVDKPSAIANKNLLLQCNVHCCRRGAYKIGAGSRPESPAPISDPHPPKRLEVRVVLCNAIRPTQTS
jgi:hypothetical protein